MRLITAPAKAVLLMAVVSGCHVQSGNYAEQLAAAQAGVATFRQLYNRQNFDALYEMFDPAALGGQSRDAFVDSQRKFYSAVGAFRAATLIGTGCFPYEVRLVYHSEFEKAKVTEAMAWSVRDGKVAAKLYQVSNGYLEAKGDSSTSCSK